jgi:hypothetical protein
MYLERTAAPLRNSWTAERRGNVITFDHLKLVRRQPTEVARFRRFLLSALPGDVTDVAILHEDDGRCCRRETWEATAEAIALAVRPPTSLVMVDLTPREVK